VPDQGGTAMLIQDGVSGFSFRTDDAGHLADRLVALKTASPELLNRVVANAADKVQHEYSAEAALERYRKLFRPD
jgi:glycosyltransferase involved in cell wall biosynthesis